MRWLDAFLSGFRWYRRWRGGHFECWWVEPCHGFVWLREPRCNEAAGTRPPACFGTPTCEEW